MSTLNHIRTIQAGQVIALQTRPDVAPKILGTFASLEEYIGYGDMEEDGADDTEADNYTTWYVTFADGTKKTLVAPMVRVIA